MSELAAGGDNEFEFIGRVNRAAAAGFARTENPQDQAAGAPHEKKQGASQGKECFHGCSDRQGDLLGSLQGQRLRNQFAEHHMQIGDQAEGDHDGNAMGIDGGVGNFMHEAERFDQTRNHGFTDPAQG